MTVALASSFEPIKAPGTVTRGKPLLDPAGPSAILGWVEGALAAPIAPTPHSLFGPRGACLHPDGSLWVSDTGHHRVLGWHQTPTQDNAPADLVIGQPSFEAEGRNGKAEPGPASLNVPTGICTWGAGLAIADAWNHRVLLWRERPRQSNQPADIVLGQDDASGALANRGADRPDAATLNWPYGVAEIDGRLAVADSGNRRVLIWDALEHSGQPADLVLGQADFETRDENAGGAVAATGMRWPHGVATWRGWLVVADAGNNRLMLWESVPTGLGVACDLVLGQESFAACDHNRAAYYPTDAALNMPYAVAAAGDRLVVADTANSRLLGWHEAIMASAAARLTGQPDFASKGDNGWEIVGRRTLCWPYGLSVRGETVAVADSGNNRVLLWDLAP